MINSLSDTVELNNGTKIPGLGLGVFQISEKDAPGVVKNAIVNGYRLIDTAAIYGNEIGTGKGIKEGLKAANLSREDLFITSKVWNSHLTYDETIAEFNASLDRLDLDYLDLFLIHWPGSDAFEDSWKALEELYAVGKIKAIGVSNFQIQHLEKLFTFAKVIPAINQIELHPKLSQLELRKYSESKDIKIQAWSPLMQGKLLSNPIIESIATHHNKSTAQIILRWDVQQDILLNVKSTHIERMHNNADIFDFELTDNEMNQLNELNEDLRVGPDPDSFDFE